MTDLCVAHVPIFRRLSREQQEAVATRARPLHVAEGDFVYHQGQRDAPLIVLHEGLVKLTRLNPDGHERVIDVLEPGDFSGEASLLTGSAPDHSAVAVGETVACSFLREDFGPLLARHPGVGMTMMAELSRRLADSQAALERVASLGVDARIADYLLTLTAGPDQRVELPLPKKDIASWLGTTPESFSRGVARLVEKNLVELDGPRGFVLRDVDRLVDLAGA